MSWRSINVLITLAVALIATAGPLSAKFDPGRMIKKVGLLLLGLSG